jgi:predicted nucleic acid-binding protein
LSRILVLDASVVVDLMGRYRPQPIEELVWAEGAALAAPELLQVEVLQTLRRLHAAGAIKRGAESAIALLQALPIRYYRHANLVAGIWSLRGHLTAYDAAYVVLARLLGGVLVTRDERLAKAPGLQVPVNVPL